MTPGVGIRVEAARVGAGWIKKKNVRDVDDVAHACVLLTGASCATGLCDTTGVFASLRRAT